MNPYEVLGVNREANEKTIKEEYRKLARKWHSDLFHTEIEIQNAELKMKEINEAFSILKDAKKRAAYDAEHPVTVNVYEYYAKKQTKTSKKTSTDLENEKQRKAVLQFLEVEYQHKEEIFEIFAEIMEGAIKNAFSEEEYVEYVALAMEEQQDCIQKIRQIIATAKKKQLKGMEANYRKAEQIMEELVQKGKETPKSIEGVRYQQETQKLSKRIQTLMKKFPSRLQKITDFKLIDMTWTFENDNQLNLARQKHQKEIKKFLKDIQWIWQTAKEREIPIGMIEFHNQEDYQEEKITLQECRQIIEDCKQVSELNLQGLQEQFWETECKYDKEMGQLIFLGLEHWRRKYKGTFICPPHVDGIGWRALIWLEKVSAISIPAHLIEEGKEIELPDDGHLKQIILTFSTKRQIVDVSKLEVDGITRKGKYICLYERYGKSNFALIDESGTWVYDEKKLCELSGVPVAKLEERESIGELQGYRNLWEKYQLQIHTWAQVTKTLPSFKIMKLLPISTESAKQWLNMDKANFEEVLAKTDEALKERVIRFYIGLGALKEEKRYQQAERLITQLDVTKMHRGRLERVPEEKVLGEDPMFSVPKEMVDLVEENKENEDFLPYVFAFLEGHQLFRSEAKKAGTQLTPEFIIATAPQYIFHKKINKDEKASDFVKELLKVEKQILPKRADKILGLYQNFRKQLQENIQKDIVETQDAGNASLTYRFLDLNSLKSYRIFEEAIRVRQRFTATKSFYAVEAENVFLTNNTHALEILDDEHKQVAIVILNLLDKGELFADIMSCEEKSVEVLEAVRRALKDQKNVNPKVTGISIGMNEAPRTSRFNQWHEVVEDAKIDWLQEVRWIKFEYRFCNRILGTSYKAYRTRFMLEGKQQYLSLPHPWDNPKKSRRNERRPYYYW